MKIDLHCHSTRSDGSDAPADLVKRAQQVGINMLALTDHDTIDGLDEARLIANDCGIALVNGVEISCEHTLTGGYGKNKAKDKIIHVLGLGFDDTHTMQLALETLQQSRATRGQKIVERLSEILSLDEGQANQLWQAVLDKAGNNPQAVGRAHIGQVLFERGVVKSVQQAFDKYLADNKPAYVAIEALTMADAIALIHQCGGKAALAHPTHYRLSATRVRKLIAEFAALGGDATEVPTDAEPKSTRQMVDRSVTEHGLSVALGSDYHGSSMPWRRLGDTPLLGDRQQGIWEQWS
ncbi:MAG: PHP domain-containing protein [Psychrobacter sp.]|nr:PHP domain-containing protein [Psychrobacter sp.]